jgi:hypothetical protein
MEIYSMCGGSDVRASRRPADRPVHANGRLVVRGRLLSPGPELDDSRSSRGAVASERRIFVMDRDGDLRQITWRCELRAVLHPDGAGSCSRRTRPAAATSTST